MNLAANLTRNAAAHPDRVAIRLGDDAVTYRDLDESSARVAGLLAGRGVRPGQPVAVMLPNVPEFAVVYYGVLRAGGVVVPMNPLLKAREVAYYLGDSGAPVIFAWHTHCRRGHAPERHRPGPRRSSSSRRRSASCSRTRRPRGEVVDRADDDTAVILYTSGTTGQPKGAELTHGNLATNVEVTRSDLLRDRPGRRDLRRSAAVPLVRADLHAQRRDRRRRVADAAAALRPDAGAGAARASIGRRCSSACRRCTARCWPYRTATTTTCRRCGCASPAARPCRSRCCASSRRRSAARCSRATACRRPRRSRRSTIPDRERKPGSIGTPIRGVEMRVVDDARAEVPPGEVGEIAIRGHNIMKGYWNKPEATAEVDLGRRLVPHRRHRPRRRGRLLLHRRPQEGPHHPRRLQRLPARDRGGALRAPGVAEAAVIGMPASGARRGGRRRGRAEARCDDHDRRAARLRQGPGRGVQVPAPRVVRRRAAQGADRKDPQAGDRGAGVRAGRRRTERIMTTSLTPDQAADLADQAAPLDALLVDAALGPARRFAPDLSTAKLAVGLARRPRVTTAPARLARRRARPDRDRHVDARPVASATAASPTRPGRRTRCCAGSCRPTSRGGQTAEQLVGDAGLDWRDEQRMRFLAENLVEALRAEQRAAGQPGVGQGGDRHRRAEPRSAADRSLVRDLAVGAADPGDGRPVGVRGRPQHRHHARARSCCAPRCSS